MDGKTLLPLVLALAAWAGIWAWWKFYPIRKSNRAELPPRSAGRPASGRAESPVIGPAVRRVLVVGPARAAAPTKTLPGPAPVVQAPPRGAWDERGWQHWRERGGTVYAGYYRLLDRRLVQQRRFPGRVIIAGKQVQAYIADPPPEIGRHPKGPCFQLTSGRWFRVHWHRPAENVDEAILYIERILDEAINGAHRRRGS